MRSHLNMLTFYILRRPGNMDPCGCPFQVEAQPELWRLFLVYIPYMVIACDTSSSVIRRDIFGHLHSPSSYYNAAQYIHLHVIQFAHGVLLAYRTPSDMGGTPSRA